MRGERHHTRVTEACLSSLEWAAERGYAGWDPYDGLNSPILSAIANNWFTRLVCMHGVHKFPINLRPILGIPKERNPKGIALFATSYLNLYEATRDDRYLDEAENLLQWLLENQSTGYDQPAWGYNFDWQNAKKFFLPAYQPSVVASVFCARSFLHHFLLTGANQSRSMAEGVANFITEELNEVQVRNHRPYSYTPYDTYVVINANALAASLLAKVGTTVNSPSLVDRADELIEFVVDTQDSSGGWYYAEPPSDSHLTHDNFHTGFVLESLHEYLDVRENKTVESAYSRGISFYREELFDDNGGPRFEHNKRYPRDAHASGQALRTFSVDSGAENLSVLRSVLEWTLDNLYDDEGYFYRRVGRVLKDRTPYMRWSQAWMCYGLSSYYSKVVAPNEHFPDERGIPVTSTG